MKIFKDRIAAGQVLAERLKGLKADLVLGIPRGGVVVAAEISQRLKLPLDIIVTRKIGAPNQPELALGALDPDGEVVLDESIMMDLGTRREELGEEIKKQWKELKRREDEYRSGKDPLNVEGKIVILVDDGMATGATVLAAARYLKRHGAKVILAIPVASKDALEKVTRELASHPERAERIEGSDEIVVLETPELFQAVGQFYQSFEPVSDEDVIKLLG